MNEEQDLIDDNNELIAIFDGWELVNENNIACFWKNGYHLYHYELDYHSDWNRLRRIWEKFRDLTFNGDLKAEVDHAHFRQNIAHCICYRDIESAHQSIVSGIQWYNSIK